MASTMNTPTGTIWGLFINRSIEVVSDAIGADATFTLCKELGMKTSYNPLIRYAVEIQVRFEEVAAGRVHPDKSRDEAMSEFGAKAFAAFADSATGKVALAMVGDDIWKTVERIPGLFRLANKFGHVSLERRDDRSFAMEYRQYRHYPAFHLGLLREGLRGAGFETECTLEVSSFVERGPGDVLTDFDIIARW